jgi:hypothetical protein
MISSISDRFPLALLLTRIAFHPPLIVAAPIETSPLFLSQFLEPSSSALPSHCEAPILVIMHLAAPSVVCAEKTLKFSPFDLVDFDGFDRSNPAFDRGLDLF